ncbi:MAG: hypothetical protein ABI318_21705, partial [Chthoniobacteraceae bacterium]
RYHDHNREKHTMSTNKKWQPGGDKAPKGSPLNIKAFEGRTTIEGEIYRSVTSSVVGPDGEDQPSSFPHLTHEAKGRAAHITSSRVVGVSGTYTIHERFHQDDDGSKLPVHDRFFAVAANGVVYPATAEWSPDVHIGKKDEKPMRGANINSAVNAKLVFNVGFKADEKSPPLSPRSSRRVVPDKGYQ